MKKLHFSALSRLALVAAAGWLLAGCDVTIGNIGGAKYTERQTKDFTVSGTPDVVVSTFDGEIEIRAADRPGVSIDVEKRGRDKQDTDQIDVTTSQNGNTITVEVKDRDQRHIRLGLGSARSANLTLLVPLEANVDAHSGDGNIRIDRVKGRVKLESGDGNITVTDLAGDLRVHTGDGTMTVEHVDGRVDLDTGDGSVSLDGKLEALRIRTGDGTVKVRAAAGSQMADDWDIHTGDGSVTLQLPQPFDADLDAHASDGTVVVTDIDVRGEVSKRTVRGQLGSGGRVLRVSTGDGTIRIARN